MATPVLQFKRGAFSNLPALKAGEPGFTTDKYDLYIGLDNNSANNKFFGSHRYWTRETASKGSGINLVESTSGTDFITLAAPASVGAAVTFYFPATQGGASSVLTNDGNGNLSWASGSANPVFSGIATFTDTTDNTLGDPNTGAVQIDGGLGVNKNVTVGAGLSVVGNAYVAGISTFVGSVTFNGGTINLGDNTSDDINVGGEFVSNLVPNTTNYYDLGTSSQRWRDLYLAGNLNVAGVITATQFNDLLISNKDIITAYIDGATETDTSANHGGIAVASTEGSPLVNFPVSGINTLPATYKQIMWVKGGTYGVGTTDAWLMNYAVGVGSTQVPNGVVFAAGSVQISSAGTVTASNFSGSLTGNASSANQVKTVTASDTNATYHITFVDSHNGSATNETVYTDDGIYYNPGTNTFTTQYGYFTGNVIVDGSITGTATTASRAQTVDVVGVATNQNYYITLVDGSGNAKSVGVDAELLYNPNTNTLTVGTGVGITQFSGSVSTGTSTSSVPTSSAIIDYVDSEIGAIDLTTSIAGDSGTGSVSTSQTLTIAGTAGEIETSAASQTITIGLPNDVVVGTSLSVPTIKATNVKASDGVNAITITSGTGDVGISSNLTVTGNLSVLGSQTIVNTETLKVEDSLIEIGLVNSGGNLVPPSSDANIDVGVIFHYYTSSAKKAGIYWDDSVSRVAIGSDLSESTSVITAAAYAALEIGSLWVTDCAGTSQVINCSGSERFLENITVDGGTF